MLYNMLYNMYIAKTHKTKVIRQCYTTVFSPRPIKLNVNKCVCVWGGIFLQDDACRLRLKMLFIEKSKMNSVKYKKIDTHVKKRK